MRTCRFRWREALSSTLYLLLLGEKHCVTELGAVAVLPAGCESWLPNSHLCDLGLVVHLSAPPRPHRYRFPHDPKVECVPLKPFVSQSGVKQRHRCSQTEVKAVVACCWGAEWFPEPGLSGATLAAWGAHCLSHGSLPHTKGYFHFSPFIVKVKIGVGDPGST